MKIDKDMGSILGPELKIDGDVIARTKETINPEIKTGEIEILIKKFYRLTTLRIMRRTIKNDGCY